MKNQIYRTEKTIPKYFCTKSGGGDKKSNIGTQLAQNTTGEIYYLTIIQATYGGIQLSILIQTLPFRKYGIIHKNKHTPMIKMNTIWKEYWLTIRK